ncbi:MAG TPA: Uma2 family endonuclease [Pirellulales bacterium]|nr:Uma2 family endonuclease [Pirellulales bacterium]
MSISLRPLPGTTRDPLYPDSDGKPMAETEYHLLAITHLYGVLRQWFLPKGVHVAADMLLYYEEGNPSAVRGPDVMVSKGVRGTHLRRSFRTWEEGVVPAVIIEVTSASTKGEDQFEKPAIYASLGVKEYLLFDPVGEYLRPRLQGFQLKGGQYVPMPQEQTDRLSSAELGLDLVIDAHLLRVVDPATGTRLPTREEYQEQVKRLRREAAEAKRATAKAGRAAAKAEQAAAKAEQDAEIERHRSAALEAENARLRALLPPDQRQGQE